MSTRGRRNLEPVGQLKLFFTFFLTKFEGEVLTILLPGVNHSVPCLRLVQTGVSSRSRDPPRSSSPSLEL